MNRLAALALTGLCLSTGALSTGCVEIRRADDSNPQEQSRAEPAAKEPARNTNSGAKNSSSYAPNEDGAPVHALPALYRPLKRIVGRRVFPFQSETSITTIGEACYTPNLAAWLKKHPPGGPLFAAVMRHEQLHARRQLAEGVDPWIDRYLNDAQFMWKEEQLGWYEQIQFLKGRGFRLDAKAVARNLKSYKNLRGRMVGYDEALKWANDVVGGRWRPR
jgi:hypothetical protein